MLTPNDVRKGDMINTTDGTTFIVADNRKGIRREVIEQATKDRGIAYVFDWYCRLSPGTDCDPYPSTWSGSERITLPPKYLESAEVIGRTIDVQAPPVVKPVPPVLGSLRDSWKGAIAVTDGHVSDCTAPVPTADDVSAIFPTDGTMMFDGGRLTKRDNARLLRRRQDRRTTLESARPIWNDNVASAVTRVYPTDGPMTSERNDGRPIQMFHSHDKRLCLYLDASRYKLASTVGKVENWKAPKAQGGGVVGYDKKGNATVIIMPVVLSR